MTTRLHRCLQEAARSSHQGFIATLVGCLEQELAAADTDAAGAAGSGATRSSDRRHDVPRSPSRGEDGVPRDRPRCT